MRDSTQITVQQEGATGTGETAAFVARLEGGLIAVSLPEGSGSIRVANPQGAVVLPLPGPVTFSDERPRVASTPARSGRVVEKGLRAGRGIARRLGGGGPGVLRSRSATLRPGRRPVQDRATPPSHLPRPAVRRNGRECRVKAISVRQATKMMSLWPALVNTLAVLATVAVVSTGGTRWAPAAFLVPLVI